MSSGDIAIPENHSRFPVLVPNYLVLFRRVRPCPFLGQVFQLCLNQCLPSSMSLLMFLLIFQRCALTLTGYFLLESHFRERHLFTPDMYSLAVMHLVWDDEDPEETLYHCEGCLFLTTDQNLFHRHRAEGAFAHKLAWMPYTDQTLTLYTVLACFEISTVATCRYCSKVFEGATSGSLFRHARGHGNSMGFRAPVTPHRARDHLLHLLRPHALSMPFLCMSHDVAFPTASLLYLHLCTVVHVPKHFLCPLCARSGVEVTPHAGLLQAHIERDHSDEISCPLDSDCQLNLARCPIQIHVLLKHSRPLSDLPYLIRQAAYFKKIVEIVPSSGYVVFHTPQSTHRHPDASLMRWVAHAMMDGLRVPINLDGPDYWLSQELIDNYNKRKFGFKVRLDSSYHIFFLISNVFFIYELMIIRRYKTL